MSSLTSIMAASRRRVDPDAADYFARIVAAGSSISSANLAAVNAFVVGCKADGIWSAIKASCILAGADTLAGALVPLVGPAPTNVSGNFVSGDYSRTTGLKSNGAASSSGKVINTGFDVVSSYKDNHHLAVYQTAKGSSGGRLYAVCHRTSGATLEAGGLEIGLSTSTGTPLFARSYTTSATIAGLASGNTFIGVSRNDPSEYIIRQGGTAQTIVDNSVSSSTPERLTIFGIATSNNTTDARLSFYSIGESAPNILTLLDARLTTLMSSLT